MQVLPAGAHLLRGDVDGLEAGRAEPVELEARAGGLVAGGQRGGAGDVGALLADGRDAAEDDVLDAGRVQVRVALAQLLEQADDQRDRLGAVQRSGVLAAPARGADRVVDERFGHGSFRPVHVMAEQSRYCQYHCHSCQAPVSVSCSTLTSTRRRHDRASTAASADGEFTVDELAARTGHDGTHGALLRNRGPAAAAAAARTDRRTTARRTGCGSN